MSLRKDTVQLDIVIGSNKSKKQLAELEAEASGLKKAIKDVKSEHLKYDKAAKGLVTAEKNMKRAADSTKLLESELVGLNAEHIKLQQQIKKTGSADEKLIAKEKELTTAIRIKGNELKFEQTLYKQLVRQQEKHIATMNRTKKGSDEYIASSKRLKEVELSIDGIRKTFDLTSMSQDDLVKRTKSLRFQMKKLDPNSKKWADLNKQLIPAEKQLKKVKEETGKTKKSFTGLIGKLKKTGTNLQGLALKFTGFMAAIGGAIAAVRAYNRIQKETSDLQNKLKFAFDVTGEPLDELTVKTKNLADRLGSDVNETFKAANAFYKEFQGEISKTEAFDLMISAADKGANSTGELLDIMKEYPAQLKQVGLSAEESLAVITQQVKEGVFSDKGIDAIKEAGIRLREMTPATLKALDAIGLSGKTIATELKTGAKTTFDVVQEVSGKLKTLKDDSPAVGMALADIFGGPGEDAGIRYLRTLEDINTNFDETETAIDDATAAQNRLNDALNVFTVDATKGTSIFGQALTSIKNEIAEIVETLNIFSDGDWLTRLKIVGNQFIKSIELPLKPFIKLYNLITGDDFSLRFDITPEKEPNFMKDYLTATFGSNIADKLLKSGSAEAKLKLKTELETAGGKGVGLDPDMQKKILADTAKLNDLIKQLNTKAIDDEQARALAELEIWKDKEDEKVTKSIASAKLKGEATTAIDRTYKDKRDKINADYEAHRKARFDEVQRFITAQEDSLLTKREDIINSEIAKIEEKYNKQIELAEGSATQIAELEKLKEDEVSAYKIQKEQELADQILSIRESAGLVTDRESMEANLAQLQEFRDLELLTEIEFERAKSIVRSDYIDGIRSKQKAAHDAEMAEKIANLNSSLEIAGAASAFFSATKDAELAKVGDNEEKKKQIQKKYADIEFAITLAQIAATAAKAAIEATALSIKNPILGAIAFTALGLQTVASTTAAVSARSSVAQLAKGKYPVIGEDDGRLYHADYTNRLGTGITTAPTLVGEEPEMVVDHKTLYNPNRDTYGMSVMDHAGAIMSLKHNTVPQRARGKYDNVNERQTSGTSTAELLQELISATKINTGTMSLLRSDMASWKSNLKAYITYTDFEDFDSKITSARNNSSVQ